MVGFVAFVYNLYKKDIRIYLLGMHVAMSRFVCNSKDLHETWWVLTRWLSLNCDPPSLEQVFLTLSIVHACRND